MSSPAIQDRLAAQTRRGGVPFRAATRTPRLLTAGIAVAAMVFAIIGIGAHHADHFEQHARDAAQSVAATGHHAAVAAGHAVMRGGSAHSHHPEKLASAVRPPSYSAAAPALGVLVAVVAVVGVLLSSSLLLAGRGPPHWYAYALGGRALLTRFCLARR